MSHNQPSPNRVQSQTGQSFAPTETFSTQSQPQEQDQPVMVVGSQYVTPTAPIKTAPSEASLSANLVIGLAIVATVLILAVLVMATGG